MTFLTEDVDGCLFVIEQKEWDFSVRQRAADLLYTMCNRTNVEQVVAQMLMYLEMADYAIREEVVSIVLAGVPLLGSALDCLSSYSPMCV